MRWVRVLALLLLVAFGARLLLGFVVRRTVKSLAEERELSCEWDELSFSLLAGRGDVRALRVAPEVADGDPPARPIVELEYAVFDLDVLALLRGRLRVRRAEVDGLESHLARDASGTWNLERHVAAAEVLSLFEASEEEEEEPVEPEEPEPLDLSLPLAVDALRFQHARLTIEDQALPEPLALAFELNAGLSRLNTSDRAARFSLTITGSDVLDGASVGGELRTNADVLSVTLDAQAGGLRPDVLAPYLRELDIRPAAETIEVSSSLRFDVSVTGEARDGLDLAAAVEDVVLTADGVEWLGLDGIALQASSIGGTRVELAPVEVRAPRVRAELLADGALRVAGIDLLPAAPEIDPEPTPPSDPFDTLRPGVLPGWASLFVREDPEAFPWELAGIEMTGGNALLVDHATTPPAELALEAETARIGTVVHDPNREQPDVPVLWRMQAPGLAQTIQIDGALRPFAPERMLEIGVTIDGIELEAIDPYLEQASLQRTVERGSFELSLSARASTDENGRTEGELEIGEVTLDEEGRLFGIRGAQVREILIDPEERLLRFGEVSLEGPTLNVERDPARNFLGFGLRLLGREALEEGVRQAGAEPVAAAPAPAPQPRPASTPALAPPRIEVGRVTWGGSQLSFVDRASEPPTELSIDRIGLELQDLVLGGAPGDTPAPPATFRAFLTAPGIAGEILAEGTVRSLPGPLDLELDVKVRGEALDGELLAPYLRRAGVDPVLRNGRVQLDIAGHLRTEDDVLVTDLTLRDGLVAQGETALVELGALEVQGLRSDAAGLRVERLFVGSPTAMVQKDDEGALLIAGLRLGAPTDEGAFDDAGDSEVEEDEPEVAPAPTKPPAPAPLALPVLPPIHVAELNVEGAAVTFRDTSLEPALETRVTVDVGARKLDTRGDTGAFDIRLGVDDTLEELVFGGNLTWNEDGLRMDGTFHGQGLEAGPFARFLPPGTEIRCDGARLAGSHELSVEAAPEGGLAAAFALREVSWGVDPQQPWLGWNGLELAATRIDPAAATVDLGPLRLDGARVSIERDEEGVLHALGLSIGNAAAGDGDALEDTSAQVVEASTTTAPAGPPPTKTPPPPRVRLTEGIALELERFAFRDHSLGADALPLSADARFHLDPAVLIEAEPGELPPLAWRLDGSVEGLVESWELAGSLQPFAAEPRIEARLVADGVRTRGLPEILPELASTIEGNLDAGRLEGALEATLFVRRARPFELGLDRPFGAEALLSELYFRDAPDGAILLGLDGVQIDARRIDPSGLVHLDMIEARTPRWSVARDADGIHTLGLTIRPPTEEQPEADAEDANAEADPVAVAESSTPTDPPAGELRIDRLLVTGIDVDLRDTSVSPAVEMPLDQLDVEVRRFTTRAFHEPHRIHFSTFLGASAEGSRAPAFEELVTSGRLSFHPALTGRARVQLAGLELTSFSGLAAEQDLLIEDGSLDSSVRVKLLGERGVRVDTSLVFSDLDLDEAEGGLLSRTLSLPMALDSALFLLRNASGEHRFRVGFAMDPEGGISARDILVAATGATGEVIAGALAGAPLRVLTSVAPGDGEARPPEEHELGFAPGATRLSSADHELVATLAKRLAARRNLTVKLEHVLGAEDLARAELLGNPSADDCLALTANLRRQREELIQIISERKLEARTLYAVGAREAAAASDELRGLEADLVGVERSLDQVLEILRSDSPRQRLKRTRTMARELAEQRLEEVARLLRAELHPAEGDRIELAGIRVNEATLDGGSVVKLELEH